jgi:hypothetical protein
MQIAPPMASQPMPPQQTPQSQMLAQVLQQMRTQPQTAAGGSANMVANAINTFGAQGAGQGANLPGGQWRDANGNASGNWMNSGLGKQLGGLFGLGQAAGGGGANPQGQIGYNSGPTGMSPYSVNPQTGLISQGAPPA